MTKFQGTKKKKLAMTVIHYMIVYVYHFFTGADPGFEEL